MIKKYKFSTLLEKMAEAGELVDTDQWIKEVKSLEKERDAFKEQLGKLMKFTAKVENFDYIWVNHSDIPLFYTMITKGHYATCIDAKQRAEIAETKIQSILDVLWNMEHKTTPSCEDCIFSLKAILLVSAKKEGEKHE